MYRFIFICCLALIGACEPSAKLVADKVFIGENIITMDKAMPSASAVAIKADEIIFVGSRDKVNTIVGDTTQIVELGDKALIPGFIDSHGHAAGLAAMMNFINASSPPVGPVENINDILELLRERIEQSSPSTNKWIVAYGYDDSLLAENRHPTRDDLDKVSKDKPIYLIHVSAHLGSANSAALAALGIDENTPNPEGGVFRRYPNSTKPNGVVEESASHMMMGSHLFSDLKNPLKLIETIDKTFEYIASFGITTMQDGASDHRLVTALRAFDLVRNVPLDTVVFQAAKDGSMPLPLKKLQKKTDGTYRGNARLGGVKLILDGSPQGRTAWLTQPYHENPTGIDGPYSAYPTSKPALFKQTTKQLLQNRIPILVHANGDAAIDLAMDAVEEAFAGQAIPDHRSVIIHSQVMRPDQLERAAKLKMVPSFFVSHTFFWGDWHRKSFGEQRAAHISPAQSAIDKGVHFTLHNDAPVVPPDMLHLMWTAVNRHTRSGFVLGPDQRISPYDALYALTLGGAYQYFEEDIKGSLTVGKQADLVILDKNPLAIDPLKIKDIAVLETIAHGKTIFRL